jgi:hypothetical protein
MLLGIIRMLKVLGILMSCKERNTRLLGNVRMLRGNVRMMLESFVVVCWVLLGVVRSCKELSRKLLGCW